MNSNKLNFSMNYGLEQWHNLHAAEIGDPIMEETASVLENRLAAIEKVNPSPISGLYLLE